MVKGITDIQQRQLEEAISPYMLIETNIKKGGLNLSPETLSIIKEAKDLGDFVAKEKLQLPKSTYDILRYGSAVEIDILNNLDKLSQYATVKMRVRKGVQYNQVLVWDTRSIENILKKTDKPKVKSQDDKKVLKEFLTSFTSFNNFNEDYKLFTKYRRLFLAKNFPITVHFIKGDNFLQDFVEKKSKVMQREKEISQEQSQFNSYDSIRLNLEQQITDKTNKFYTEDKTGLNIKAKKDQIEKLESSEPLASYSKLLNDIIETFDAYATKQNVNLSFDEQNVLRDLKESVITHEKNVDLHFNSLLTVIIRHADVAFGKKHWYTKLLQELGSIEKIDSFIRSGPGYKAWIEAREVAKDVYELQQSSDFKNFQETITNLESEIKKNEEFLNRSSERLRKFNQDLDELNGSMSSLKKNLDQWTLDAKNLL